MYAPTPEGIIGNEDCGQMSAWYIFSSLGFYPVCPGSNQFVLTAPLFERATVRLANGRTLTVTADTPRRNRYVGAVTLNGKAVDTNYITYEQLMEGGELHFTMLPEADLTRGTSPEAQPLFAHMRRGRLDSLHDAVGEPLHRAGRRCPGDDDARGRDPLYARRLGARFALGPL